ncbi:hypothetical protein EV715DRAFT_214140 [Schizophyllum commune]
MPESSISPPSSAGCRPLRHRLLPSWIVRYFSRGRASPSAPIASSATDSSPKAPGDPSDGHQHHPQPSFSAAIATPPPTSPSPGLRARLSISKLYRRLSRSLAPSSRGSPPTPVRSPSPQPVSDALQDAIVHISTAPKDAANAPAADPMARMWSEAVAEWQRKAGVDLNAPEATLFSSKEALANYVAKMEADSQGDYEMNRWGRLRNTIFPLARIVAKLCGPIGDTLSSTVLPPSKVMFAAMGLIISATVQAHEEFELITDAFNEIRVHLQVVEIVTAHPGRLLYDTSLELLVQVLTVFGVITKMRHANYAGRVLKALVDIRPLSDSLQGLRRITSRYKEAIVAGTLEVVTGIKASEELERIRMWLRFDSVDSSQRMSSLLNDRAEGTGLWLFDDKTFVKFLEGQIKVLSIEGKAGCGKSTIVASTSRHLRAYCASRGPTHVVLAHFFDAANNSGQGTLDSVLSSFLCQLALRDQCCMDMLAAARQQSISNGCFTCREKLDTLLGMLNTRLQGFLIIDALDEALEHERAKVLGALKKLRSCTNLSILLSTRVPLGEDQGIHHTAVSIDLVPNNTDIQTALNIDFSDGGRLAGIANAETVRHKVMCRAGRKYVTNILYSFFFVNHASSMRWTSLVVEQLQSYVSAPHKMDKLMKELPPTLEELYANRLNATPSGDVEDIRRLFAWILYYVPWIFHIKVDQLAIVLAFDYSQHMPEYKPDWLSTKPDTIVSKLLNSMFFTMHHGVVRIAHDSVRDFLAHLPPSSPFYISEDDAVCLMVRTSLAYLLAVVEGIAPTDYDKSIVELWHQRPCNLPDYNDATLEQDITDVLGKIRPSGATSTERILSPALHTAASQGNEKLVLLLLHSGANASTPLQKDDSRLIDDGADIEDCNEGGYTSLHLAALNQNLDVVNLLLERGAHIAARTKQLDTPLTLAASDGRENVIRLLLDKGADIEDCNEGGYTSLHRAASCGYFSTVSLLLERGANVNAVNNAYRTPLHIAAQFGYIHIIRLLVDRGSALEARDEDGGTPLYLAVYSRKEEAIGILLSFGSDPRTRADDGTTLLDAVGRMRWLMKDAEKDAHVRELLMRAGCIEETGKIPLEGRGTAGKR